MKNKKLVGIVIKFNELKGFGFIDSGNEQYFFHFSEILTNGRKILNPGDEVIFYPEETNKGYKAIHIQKLSEKIENYLDR